VFTPNLFKPMSFSDERDYCSRFLQAKRPFRRATNNDKTNDLQIKQLCDTHIAGRFSESTWNE